MSGGATADGDALRLDLELTCERGEGGKAFGYKEDGSDGVQQLRTSFRNDNGECEITIARIIRPII